MLLTAPTEPVKATELTVGTVVDELPDAILVIAILEKFEPIVYLLVLF